MHGTSPPCMVCAHLVIRNGKPVGYNAAGEPNPDPNWEDLREAWCDKCNWWWKWPLPIPNIYNLLAKSPIMVCENCLKEYKKYHSHEDDLNGWWEENPRQR